MRKGADIDSAQHVCCSDGRQQWFQQATDKYRSEVVGREGVFGTLHNETVAVSWPSPALTVRARQKVRSSRRGAFCDCATVSMCGITIDCGRLRSALVACQGIFAVAQPARLF